MGGGVKYKPIAMWLTLVAGMVLIMAIIGAITRLTNSGLSMVEWRPLLGTLPPLNEAEWTRVYDLYKQSPEFAAKHNWMELSDFKQIFFWEWLHRLFGRLIGLVYALPLLFFWITKKIPRGYHLKLLVGLVLGGLQGLMGWYMVKSGLVDRPSVSHFRLAAHLSLAFIIFGYLWWLALDFWGAKKQESIFCLRRHGWIAFALLCCTIIWGAFTAGLDAGLVYNSFPLMDGRFFPAGAFNPLLEHGWVQFTHRWLAMVSAFFILTFAWRIKNILLGLVVALQVTLGIATLLTQVHIHVAATHQAGAFILVGIMIYVLRGLKRKTVS